MSQISGTFKVCAMRWAAPNGKSEKVVQSTRLNVECLMFNVERNFLAKTRLCQSVNRVQTVLMNQSNVFPLYIGMVIMG